MGKDESMIDMIKKLELSYDLFIALKSYCDEKDIMFLSAPHSDDAIDFLEPLMPAYKIASGDLVNIPLLEKIAKKNMPVILSTGMATIEEVEEGITAIRKYGNMQIIVLQCTTNYPAKLNETNLRAMQSMKNRFNVLVGYSDHTLGLEASKVAVELGAVVIEKHFTLDKSLPGPDHKASMNPAELRELVECIKSRRLDVDEKIREEILGSCEKKPSETELKNIPIVRKSLIAKKDIAKGSLITEDMIIVKRPGIGIKPRDYRKVIGMKARLDIGADDIISWSQLE
jgi:N-acetylneuraminate synthase/N,N'-diacetyllegionaminate synthase